MEFEEFERELLEAAGFTCGFARAEYRLRHDPGAWIVVYKAESWEVFINEGGNISEYRYCCSLASALFVALALFAGFHG